MGAAHSSTRTASRQAAQSAVIADEVALSLLLHLTGTLRHVSRELDLICSSLGSAADQYSFEELLSLCDSAQKLALQLRPLPSSVTAVSAVKKQVVSAEVQHYVAAAAAALQALKKLLESSARHQQQDPFRDLIKDTASIRSSIAALCGALKHIVEHKHSQQSAGLSFPAAAKLQAAGDEAAAAAMCMTVQELLGLLSSRDSMHREAGRLMYEDLLIEQKRALNMLVLSLRSLPGLLTAPVQSNTLDDWKAAEDQSGPPRLMWHMAWHACNDPCSASDGVAQGEWEDGCYDHADIDYAAYDDAAYDDAAYDYGDGDVAGSYGGLDFAAPDHLPAAAVPSEAPAGSRQDPPVEHHTSAQGPTAGETPFGNLKSGALENQRTSARPSQPPARPPAPPCRPVRTNHLQVCSSVGSVASVALIASVIFRGGHWYWGPRTPTAAGAAATQQQQQQQQQFAAAPSAVSSRALAPPEKYVSQQVLFATDRDYDYSKRGGAEYGFGTKQQDLLHYGHATVTLPIDRDPGSEHARVVPRNAPASEAHWYHIRLRREDVYVREHDEANSDFDWFRQQVKQAVEGSKRRELVIYVHGYNTSFASSVKTAAQLVVDTELCCDHGEYGSRAALAFDWSSRSSLFAYDFVPWSNDRRRAEQAGAKLAELLTDLAATLTECNGIHILCHSMGNFVFHQAMVKRFRPQRSPELNLRVTEAASGLFGNLRSVIFAAADLRRMEMKEVLLELENAAGADTRQLVLYCSKDDIALRVSTWLRSAGGDGTGRAGYYQPKSRSLLHPRHGHAIHPFLHSIKPAAQQGGGIAAKGWLQTVDASGYHTDWLGHGYFSSSKALLEDIANVFSGKQREHYTIRIRQQEEVGCKECWNTIKEGRSRFFCIHSDPPSNREGSSSKLQSAGTAVCSCCQ